MGHDWIHFDIHGRVRMKVDIASGSSRYLSDIFAGFRVETVSDPNIVVSGGEEELERMSTAEGILEFNDRGVWLRDLGVQILFDNGNITLLGKRELLTAVVPLVDLQMVEAGAAMVHSATFSLSGHGVLMAAWGGVGKTSTMAKLVNDFHAGFMGDDWAFLTTEGDLLAFEKPMFIKPHHKPIYPHLFKSKRKPLVPTAFSRPLGRVTTRVHPLITMFPKLAALIRKWSPEHMMVSPSKALPEATIVDRERIGLAVFAERYHGSEMEVVEKPADWMVSRVVGNFHAEMAQHSRDVLTALGATGHVPIERFHASKGEIVGKGLSGVPCYELRVPADWSADRASDNIVSTILELVGGSGT